MVTTPATLTSRVFATDRRSAERVDVALWVRIRVQGQPEHPARIANISRTGFMAMTPCPVYDYAPVLVELPRIGWVRATMLWALGDRIGGEFEQLIEPDDFAKLRPFFI